MLMERLIACAKRRGLKRLEGAVLRANRGMLKFCEQLGFEVHENADDSEQVTVVLPLS
jgi:GNAT superfamily N-acetyltransferase